VSLIRFHPWRTADHQSEVPGWKTNGRCLTIDLYRLRILFVVLDRDSAARLQRSRFKADAWWMDDYQWSVRDQ
jgi:hypothetical protein